MHLWGTLPHKIRHVPTQEEWSPVDYADFLRAKEDAEKCSIKGSSTDKQICKCYVLTDFFLSTKDVYEDPCYQLQFGINIEFISSVMLMELFSSSTRQGFRYNLELI